MQLGEKSAFFIPSDQSVNFCQSPVMKDLCFCPKVFDDPLRKKKTCVCGKNIFLMIGLFVIIDEENQSLALRLQDTFNPMSINGKKRAKYSLVRPDLQISQKYVSNQIEIA
jgi:hypothetical protein